MNKFWAGAFVVALAGSAVAGEETRTVQPREWKIKVANPMKSGGQSWGVSVGAYFPKDPDIRALFGDTLIRFGLSPVSRKFDKKFDITTDVNVLWANDNGARLLVVPVTVGGLMGFGDDSMKGYVAVNAGPAYFDYKLFRLVDPVDGAPVIVEYRDHAFGWNANIEGGVLISERLSITGRYDWYKKFDDFDFGGFSINVNLALFKW